MENEILEILKRLENRMDTIDARMESMENKIETMDSKINRIEHKLDGVHEQTAILTEFRTETNLKFDKLINVTKDNCFEIANLKIIK